MDADHPSKGVLFPRLITISVQLSMAARNSPEVAVENSPLHCGSVSSVAAGRDDFGEFGEVEFGDRLERLGGCAVTEALR